MKVGLMFATAGIVLAIVSAVISPRTSPSATPKGVIESLVGWAILGAFGGGLVLTCAAILCGLAMGALMRFKRWSPADVVVDPATGESFGSVVCTTKDERAAVFGPSSPKIMQLGWRIGVVAVVVLGIPLSIVAIVRSSGWQDVMKALVLMLGILTISPLAFSRFTSRWELIRGVSGPLIRIWESSLLRSDRSHEVSAENFVRVSARKNASDFWTVELNYRSERHDRCELIRLALLDATSIGRWQAERLAEFVAQWMTPTASAAPVPESRDGVQVKPAEPSHAAGGR